MLPFLNDERTTVTRQDAKINLYGLKYDFSEDIQIEERLGKPNKDEVNILLSHAPFILMNMPIGEQI